MAYEILKKFIRNLLICIVILVIVLSGLWWLFGMYDKDCHERIASEYCEENNLSLFDSFSDSFRCIEQGDLRNNPYGKVTRFFYLPKENKECLTKEPKSWGKI